MKSDSNQLATSSAVDFEVSLTDLEIVGEAETKVLKALARETNAPNTKTSVTSAMRYWEAWHQARYNAPLPWPNNPVPVETVLMYLHDHAVINPDEPGESAYNMPEWVEAKLLATGAKRRAGPQKYATWTQRLAMLSIAHQEQKMDAENPCRHQKVVKLVQLAKKPAEKCLLMGKKHPPAIRVAVEAMVATCDDTVAGLRDRALLMFAFASGGRRRSEVASAVFEQLVRYDAEDEMGSFHYIYHLTGAKGQLAGKPSAKPVRGRAAIALEAWIDALSRAKIPLEGPIFRPVRGTKNVWFGPHLSGHTVNKIFKSRAAMAGLDKALTAHSLRGGFITQAHRDGLHILDAMALSGHRDIKTVKNHYHTDIDAERNPAGTLMG